MSDRHVPTTEARMAPVATSARNTAEAVGESRDGNAAGRNDSPTRLEPASAPEPTARRLTPRWLRQYIVALVLLDAVMAGLSALTAYLLRFGNRTVHNEAIVALLFPVVIVASAHIARAYEPRFVCSGSDEYRRYFDACIRVAALLG